MARVINKLSDLGPLACTRPVWVGKSKLITDKVINYLLSCGSKRNKFHKYYFIMLAWGCQKVFFRGFKKASNVSFVDYVGWST